MILLFRTVVVKSNVQTRQPMKKMMFLTHVYQRIASFVFALAVVSTAIRSRQGERVIHAGPKEEDLRFVTDPSANVHGKFTHNSGMQIVPSMP